MFHENLPRIISQTARKEGDITHCAGLNKRVAGAGLELSFGYFRWVIDLGFFHQLNIHVLALF